MPDLLSVGPLAEAARVSQALFEPVDWSNGFLKFAGRLPATVAASAYLPSFCTPWSSAASWNVCMFALVEPSLARLCMAMKFGMAIAARMPMITTTIISSIRVKPFLPRSMGWSPPCLDRLPDDPYAGFDPDKAGPMPSRREGISLRQDFERAGFNEARAHSGA